MSDDEHKYVKVDLNETAQRTVCNVTSIPTVCLQDYQTTFECAVNMCTAVNGTVPKIFSDDEIKLMDCDGTNCMGRIKAGLMAEVFWLDLR